ncbi:MAG: bifunctional nuclease family protein [Chloroflexi bacterium]|nr:bifunctional nuclease family protein [Chloroflexota bacterium]
MIRVEIDSIRVSLMSQDRVVVLKDSETDRYLPIWIGQPEAEALRVELQGIQTQRPLTHDLLKAIIKELGGEIDYILINDLRHDIYFATIRVSMDGKAYDIDARPSDSINLAVRFKVPIYVEETVMDRAAIEPEEEIAVDDDETGAEVSEQGDEESADLGVFKDFLDTLDLDDLDSD